MAKALAAVTDEAAQETPDEVRLYGAPFLIVAYYGAEGNLPETFPMMNLDPAISAAREIYRDGTYYLIKVVHSYTNHTIAQFSRYQTDNERGVIDHAHEAVKVDEPKA